MDIDFESMGFLLDPHETYDKIFASQPIFYSQKYGAWIFADFATVKLALSDDENFAYNKRIKPAGIQQSSSGKLLANWILNQTEEDHKTFKRIIGTFFSSSAVGRLELYMQEETRKICDGFNEQEIDLADVYGNFFPMKLMTKILGLREVDFDVIKKASRMAEHYAYFPNTDKDKKIFEFAVFTLEKFVKNILENNHYSNDGLIHHLASFYKNGEITLDELVSNTILFVIASIETTSYSLNNALMLLLKYPEQRALFLQNSDKANQYIDELMRFESSVSYVRRFAVKDFDMAGNKIKKGDLVLLLVNAANRDPLVYNEPNEFNLEREHIKNLAFGHGVHVCLGLHLAKMEIKVATTYFFNRYPKCELVNETVQWNDRFGFRGIVKMNVKLN